jgi:hypothetical protein
LPDAGVCEETVCALALMPRRPMMHRMNVAARMLAPPRAVFNKAYGLALISTVIIS